MGKWMVEGTQSYNRPSIESQQETQITLQF